MSCEFCSKKLTPLDNTENFQLHTSVQGNKLHLVYSAYSGDSDIDTEIKTNYCPACGRNLYKKDVVE